MDFAALNKEATALIKSLGFPISVTREGVVVGKGSAVVTPNKRREGSTDTSLTNISEKTMFVTATGKLDPQVGDVVTSKVGSWSIVAVEAYKPSTVAIAFKLQVA